MKHPLALLVVTIVLWAAATTVTLAQDTAAGTVVITLPADAKLYFNDVLTHTPGATRTFATPPLQFGMNYTYQLRAEVTRQGKPVSETKQIVVRAGETTNVDFSPLGTEAIGHPSPAAGTPPATDAGWPRKFVSDGTTFTIYQPQLEKWDMNRLEGRAAVAVETQASPQATYGV